MGNLSELHSEKKYYVCTCKIGTLMIDVLRGYFVYLLAIIEFVEVLTYLFILELNQYLLVKFLPSLVSEVRPPVIVTKFPI